MISQISPLTSLRFFAAMSVVLAHLQIFHPGGSLGVQFFFVLSGFILTLNYRDRFATAIHRSDVLSFLCLRLGRLYPIYLVTLLMSALLWIGSPWPLRPSETLRWVFMLQSYWPMGVRVFLLNGPSWSVSDEMFFYALLPLLLFGMLGSGLGRRIGSTILVLACVSVPAARMASAASFPSGSFEWWLTYIAPFTRLLEFVFGILLPLMFNEMDLRLPRGRWVGTLLEAGALGLVIAAVAYGNPLPRLITGDFFYTPLMGLVIFCFARNGGWFSAMLSARLLVHLGEVSYSIYMTHAIVFEWAGRFLSTGFYGLHSEVWIIEAQVGLVLLVICLSDTLFRWVETPGRRLTRQFTQRYFS